MFYDFIFFWVSKRRKTRNLHRMHGAYVPRSKTPSSPHMQCIHEVNTSHYMARNAFLVATMTCFIERLHAMRAASCSYPELSPRLFRPIPWFCRRPVTLSAHITLDPDRFHARETIVHYCKFNVFQEGKIIKNSRGKRR